MGGILTTGSLPALVYGALMMYPEGYSEAVLSISGLLLAYGAGLLPLMAGMLLWETSVAGKTAWLPLAGALVAVASGAIWLRRSIELFRIADRAWLPSSFLVAGLVAVTVWSGALVIRGRRRRAATD